METDGSAARIIEHAGKGEVLSPARPSGKLLLFLFLHLRASSQARLLDSCAWSTGEVTADVGALSGGGRGGSRYWLPDGVWMCFLDVVIPERVPYALRLYRRTGRREGEGPGSSARRGGVRVPFPPDLVWEVDLGP